MKTGTVKEVRWSNSEYYLSFQMREQLAGENLADDLQVMNFAYTDYGGSWLDKVIIAFLTKKRIRTMLKEKTSYFGENCILWSKKYVEFFSQPGYEYLNDEEFSAFLSEMTDKLERHEFKGAVDDYCRSNEIECNDKKKNGAVQALFSKHSREFTIFYTQLDYTDDKLESTLIDFFKKEEKIILNWDATKEDAKIIDQIAYRAAAFLNYSKTFIEMDIISIHLNDNELDLEKLLLCTEIDFNHDVVGIFKNINRKTGKLKNNFLLKCAK